MSHLKPDNAEQLEDAIKWALSEEQSLEVLGTGSKKSLGRKVLADHQLDLSAQHGITLYEPEELVLSAGAGTPLSEIDDALKENNQYMAFEPMDYGYLLSGETHPGTLGGAIACNLSGPRRVKAGAARDHFLGFSGVSGRGETFKSGGRVVKNVTGYDLMKLMAGSYGTLAVMSDITIKVLPSPPLENSFILAGLSDKQAGKVLTLAMNSSCEVSSAAHLPKVLTQRVSELGDREAATILRLEGHGPSVSYRAEKLADLLAEFGPGRVLTQQDSLSLWQKLRDGLPLVGDEAGSPDNSIWRVSLPPSKGPGLIRSLKLQEGAEYYYDWAGGLIWVSLPGDNNARSIREFLADSGGHATLVSGVDNSDDSEVPTHPMGQGEHLLMQRIKENFDPKGILNPGRLYSDL